MNDINKVVLVGRLTRKPEKRQVNDTFVTNFCIATNRSFSNKDYVSFVDCQAWGGLAELVAKFCDKGMRICVDGRLYQQQYKNKEGNTINKIMVTAENVQFLEPKKKEVTNQNSSFEDAMPFDDSGLF